MNSKEKKSMIEAAVNFFEPIDHIKIEKTYEEKIVPMGSTSIVIDLQQVITINGKSKVFNFTFIQQGNPKSLLKEIPRLISIQFLIKNSYSIIIAPYLSPQALEICKSNNLNAIDLSGNAFIKIDSILIFISGKKNISPRKRNLTRFLSKKELMVVRCFFEKPHKKWSTIELSKRAHSSYSLTWNCIKKLKNNSIIDDSWGQNNLLDIGKLIDYYSSSYEQKSGCVTYFTSKKPDIIINEIVEYCREMKHSYAFTNSVAASQYLDNISINSIDLYTDNYPQNVFKVLNLSRKPEANMVPINFLKPQDEYPLIHYKRAGKLVVVNDLQLYVDLKSMRHDEGIAQRFREHIIEKFNRLEHNV